MGKKPQNKQFAASGVDAALDLMNAATGKETEPDRHPERRVKAAYLKWSEERLPELKKEEPKLRMSQLNEILQKEWKKSPKNPLNMENVAYNATEEQVKQTKQQIRDKKLKNYEI